MVVLLVGGDDVDDEIVDGYIGWLSSIGFMDGVWVGGMTMLEDVRDRLLVRVVDWLDW